MSLITVLYRGLLRAVDSTSRLYPTITHITIREPIVGDLAAYNSHAATGAEYLLESAEAIVPGLEVPPEQSTLSWKDVKRLIKANFVANKGVHHDQVPALTNQAFNALRALPDQAYLEACSCVTEAEGIMVEATSCHSDKDPAGALSGMSRSFFRYRIRITNQREYPIKVLGRHWWIKREDGKLEAVVQKSPDNGIVGQQPIIRPGGCFQYYSGAHLTNIEADEVPCGSMEGSFVVDVYGGDHSTDVAVERVEVPVGPFQLRPAVIRPSRK